MENKTIHYLQMLLSILTKENKITVDTVNLEELIKYYKFVNEVKKCGNK